MPELWGVINVTPDSFSDGGRFLDRGAAVAHGRALLEQGADVLDVGGESSRPAGRTYGEGYDDVSAAKEIARVVPVIELLSDELRARVSVDTVKAEVSVVLVRPAGSLLGFTVAACRPGKPPGTPECSNESNPVTVTVPHDTLQEPKGLRVITVTVEIRE